MNTGLTDELYSQLEGAPLQGIAQKLGIGPAQMAGAVSAALPLLLGALGRNSQQPQGAQSLFGALEQDHRGVDMTSLLGSVLGGNHSAPGTGMDQGSKILGHVFGNQQPRVTQSLGQVTGLGSDKSKRLLELLAPVVMAYVAKQLFNRRQAHAASGATASAPAASPQVLGQVLGQETQRVRQQGGIAGGLLGSVLDRDGDGDVDFNDLIKAGGQVLGGSPLA